MAFPETHRFAFDYESCFVIRKHVALQPLAIPDFSTGGSDLKKCLDVSMQITESMSVSIASRLVE